MSSQYLLDAICAAGGDSLEACFTIESNKNSEDPVIDLKAEGELRSKRVYFLRWEKNSDDSLLRKSIKVFVENAVTRAALAGHQSIAFPAIGCGLFGCPASMVAQAMVEEAQRLTQQHHISIVFVIQPEKANIHDEFQKQIESIRQPVLPIQSSETTSVTINKGMIEVQIGDMTTQAVCLKKLFFTTVFSYLIG